MSSSQYSQAYHNNLLLMDKIQRDLASMTTPVHTLTASDRCPAHLQQLSKDLLQMKVRITVGRGKMEMMALDELHKDNEKKRKDASDKKRAMRTKTAGLADSGERGSGAVAAAGETTAPLPLPPLDGGPAPRLVWVRRVPEEEEEEEEHDTEHDQ